MSLYYVGLDYHLRSSTMVMLDAHGKKVAQRTIRGHWSKMVQWLKSQVKPMAVCFEASAGYGPLHDQLATFARRVEVAHPGELRLIFRSKRKNDRADAEKLAKLLFLDEVPGVHVPEIETRTWRELIQFRDTQVRSRTQIKNQIRSLLRNQGVAVPKTRRNLWSAAGRRWLESLSWPATTAAFRCELLLDQLTQLEASIDKATKRLDAIAAQHPGVQLLMTIPGVGPRTAEAFVAHVDDPRRFTRISRIGSYFGLVPCQDSSADVQRLGHITKQGPAVARKLLTEAAWQAIRKCPALRGFFDRVTGGRKDRHRIAIIAVAHKLARIMLAMLRSGETWDPERHGTQKEKQATGLRPAA